MYGWRARIGTLYPSTGTTTLSEWTNWAPEGVAFPSVPFQIVDVTPETVGERVGQLAQVAELLGPSEADAVVQVGTPFGFVAGRSGDETLNRRLEAVTGIPSVTMMTACIEALIAIGIQRPLVVTAYVSELNALLASRLREDGIEPVHLEGLGIRSNLEINRQPPTRGYRAVKSALAAIATNVGHQRPDGIFLVCGGLPTFEILALLEEDIGLPVVSSNGAGLWAGLRRAVVSTHIPGLGTLFK